jgi:hypothetical protein
MVSEMRELLGTFGLVGKFRVKVTGETEISGMNKFKAHQTRKTCNLRFISPTDLLLCLVLATFVPIATVMYGMCNYMEHVRREQLFQY